MEKLKQHWGLIFLVGIWVVIVTKSFVAGKWLMGWDNLMPELDFGLNLSRTISSVWQEYRGLGYPDGMAQAADLSRQLFLWLISLMAPHHILRFVWMSIMLLVGPLGVYFLGQFFGWKQNSRITAAVVYLCNLATIQYFFTPFEAFSSFFGFLPWLIFGYWQFIRSPKISTAGWLVLISFLGASAFVVQTLFIVYLVVLGLITIIELGSEGIRKIVPAFVGGLLVFVSHAYWLLPVGYFASTHAHEVGAGKANSMSTVDMQFLNKEYGTFSNVALGIGFPFGYTDWVEADRIDYMMYEWRDWVDEWWLRVPGVLMYLLVIVGLSFGLKHGNSKRYRWFGLVLLVFSSLILTGGNGLFGKPFEMAGEHVPFFNQLFRAVHTKWSIVWALALALCCGNLIGFIESFKKYVGWVLSLFVISVSILVVWPVFTKGIIYKNLWVDLPKDYQTIFTVLHHQPYGRVMSFPLHTYWGWLNHSWGYRGSGFSWFGISYPLLDRSFDVWNPYNEWFYLEASNAFSSGNFDAFRRVLEKYQVAYVVADKTVELPGTDQSLLQWQAWESTVKELNFVKIWSGETMDLYRISPRTQAFLLQSWQEVDNDLLMSRNDFVYEQGNYITQPGTNNRYPFTGVLTETIEDQIVIRGEDIWVEVEKIESDVTTPSNQIRIGTDARSLRALWKLDSQKIRVVDLLEVKEPENCGVFPEIGKARREVKDEKVRYSARDQAYSCDHFFVEMDDTDYVLEVVGETIKGKPSKLMVTDNTSLRNIVDVLLPQGKYKKYYSIPNEFVGEDGVTLNLEVRSFMGIESISEVESIRFYPAPLAEIARINAEKQPFIFQQNEIIEAQVKKFGFSRYEITFPKRDEKSVLVLPQTFEAGWIGNTNKSQLTHVKANGWANGWIVEPGTTRVVLWYWPQLLQWGGYLALLCMVVGLIFLRRWKNFQ